MLEVRNVTKIYGDKNGFRALDDVSINFGSRGLVVVLGKSGCGKSTLLNIVGGLDTATYGEVVVNGKSTKKFKKSDFDAYRNTYVGIVFQEFNLIDEISVYDNINMTMKLQEKNADVNTVDEALESVGLANLGYRKPSELSGGQRQRVAIARALLKKPEIILADEPTGALDSSTGEGVFETLKRISLDKLVIVVTHNKELAYSYADRIIELSDGKVIGDSMKDAKTDKSVKELEGGVIEISAGGTVTEDMLNARLEDGKTNYIGLSHEKDRIALAYPETVDGFYESSDKASFAPTEKEKIERDDKPFVLSKGKLSVKDSVKFARAGRKRAKRRYRFLTVVTSICFTFFSLALMVGMISTPSLVANSSFDGDAQPLVAVAAPNGGGYYGVRDITSEDIDKVGRITGMTPAPASNVRAYPAFADTDNSAINGYEPWEGFDMSSFSCILETEKISYLGLRFAAGGDCVADDDIVISDFAAFVLAKRGYLGYSADGTYAVQRPAKISDIVNTRVLMLDTQKSYRVAGIYATNYERYKSLMSSTLFGVDESLVNKFAGNKEFMYRNIIARRGFAAAYGKDRIVSDQSQDLEVTLYDATGYVVSSYTDIPSLKYEPSTLQGKLLWSKEKDADGAYVAPVKLEDREMAISYYTLVRLLGGYDDPADPEELLKRENFDAVVGAAYSLHIYRNGSGRGSFDEVRIAAVMLPGEDHRYYEFMLSDDLTDALESDESYSLMYVNRGGSSVLLKSVLAELGDAGYVYGNAVADYGSVASFVYMLARFAKGFLIAAVILLVLAFFTIFNYMSAAVRFRTKEIAVYRIIGAKTSDIFRMFLAEGGFIVLFTSLISIALSYFLSVFVNDALSSVLSVIGVGFNIMNFGWIVNPFAIILGSAFIVTVSSIVPILRITRKSPIEAVKLI